MQPLHRGDVGLHRSLDGEDLRALVLHPEEARRGVPDQVNVTVAVDVRGVDPEREGGPGDVLDRPEGARPEVLDPPDPVGREVPRHEVEVPVPVEVCSLGVVGAGPSGEGGGRREGPGAVGVLVPEQVTAHEPPREEVSVAVAIEVRHVHEVRLVEARHRLLRAEALGPDAEELRPGDGAEVRVPAEVPLRIGDPAKELVREVGCLVVRDHRGDEDRAAAVIQVGQIDPQLDACGHRARLGLIGRGVRAPPPLRRRWSRRTPPGSPWR